MELWFIHLAAPKHQGFEKDVVPESKADSCCKHSWPEIMDKQTKRKEDIGGWNPIHWNDGLPKLLFFQ